MGYVYKEFAGYRVMLRIISGFKYLKYLWNLKIFDLWIFNPWRIKYDT